MATETITRPELTPDLCQGIVVTATPHSERFTNRGQDLFDLGVVDVDQAQKHKSKIQTALRVIQYQIAQGDIQSGPGISVGDSSDSVLANAH
jgi:hypothetical protein